jgi:hypothetical protein
VYQPDDKRLASEKCEENKALLEEDYKDSKLLTWFECEDAISTTWCSTEETPVTWHESKVGPLLICCGIKETNFA